MAKHTGLPESGAENPDLEFDLDVDAVETAPPRFGRLAMWAVSATALACGVAGTVAYDVWFNQDQRAYADAMVGARQALSKSAAPAVDIATLTGGTNGTSGTSELVNAPEGALVAASPAVTTYVPPSTQATEPANVASTSTPAEVAGTPETGLDTAPQPARNPAAWTGRVATGATPSSDIPALAANAGTASASAMPSASSALAADADFNADPTDFRQSDPLIAADTAAQAPAAAPAHLTRTSPAIAKCAAFPPERHHHAQRAKPTPPPSLFARMGAFFHRASYRQHGNPSQRDLYDHS
jgi:hypothetical protein